MSMIKTEREYQETQQLLKQGRDFGEKQRAQLEAMDLTSAQVEVAMSPLLAMQAQMQGELEWYERARRGEIRPLPNLTSIGLSLIALRIAKGLTQRQLAERLGVNEAQVSKDEKNEYHGISVERAQRIIDALGGSVTLSVSTEHRVDETPELIPAR